MERAAVLRAPDYHLGMITLRCTRTLLDRLRVPHATDHASPPDGALGDWYANLIRVGRDQLLVAMSERSYLTVVLPAKGLADLLPREFPRMVRLLLAELAVPEEVIAREVVAMQPLSYARTRSKSLVANLNERVRMVDILWRDGLAPIDIMERMAAQLGPAALSYEPPSHLARRVLGLDPMAPPPATIARLHVTLEGLKPAIWRSFIVPADITLPKLHHALQLVMGWEDVHEHEFEIAGAHYGMPDPDFPIAGMKAEGGLRLSGLVRPGERFRYWYDFGDDWWHEVRVEYLGANVDGVRGVVCLDGANRCPPEDVGGPPGYLELLHALRDPAHERHREMLEWFGSERYDPTAFDPMLANARLRALLGRV